VNLVAVRVMLTWIDRLVRYTRTKKNWTTPHRVYMSRQMYQAANDRQESLELSGEA
jgi:hypothetical protein